MENDQVICSDFSDLVQDTLQEFHSDEGECSEKEEKHTSDGSVTDPEDIGSDMECIEDEAVGLGDNELDVEPVENVQEAGCGNNINLENRNSFVLCGRILRLMGDEHTCRAFGRHLRDIGDAITLERTIRVILAELTEQEQVVPV